MQTIITLTYYDEKGSWYTKHSIFNDTSYGKWIEDNVKPNTFVLVKSNKGYECYINTRYVTEIKITKKQKV